MKVHIRRLLPPLLHSAAGGVAEVLLAVAEISSNGASDAVHSPHGRPRFFMDDALAVMLDCSTQFFRDTMQTATVADTVPHLTRKNAWQDVKAAPIV
jgi:hypothetical protein